VSLTISFNKTRLIGGEGGLTIFGLAAQGRIQNEILNQYNYNLESTVAHIQETAVSIPARTRTQVVIHWKKIWEDGLARLGQRAEVLAEVPYSVTVALRFDKQQIDVP
jgi:hypothetical protein